MLWVMLPCPSPVLPPYKAPYVSATANHWHGPRHPWQFQPLVHKCPVPQGMPCPSCHASVWQTYLSSVNTNINAASAKSCLTPPGGFREAFFKLSQHTLSLAFSWPGCLEGRDLTLFISVCHRPLVFNRWIGEWPRILKWWFWPY